MKWPMVKLGELVAVKGGKRLPKGTTYADEITSHPYIRVCDMGQGELKTPDLELKYISETVFKSISRYTISSDDVYISIAGSIGIVGSIPSRLNGANLTENAAKLVINDSSILSKEFLIWFLSTKGKSDIDAKTKATSQPKLALFRIEELEIPLPPLDEQKRIAAILDKADAIRRKRQQAIELADEFLRSVFLDMFGDPVTNPKGWPESRIDNLCQIVRGSSPRPKGDPRYYGGPIPRLMVADLTRDGKKVTPRIDSLTEEGAKKSRPVKSGTVVMAVSGNVGLTSVLATDACIHDGFIAYTNLKIDWIISDFLQEMMTFLKSTHASRQAGAIFQNLTTTQIKEMVIPLPPIELQEKYVKISKRIGEINFCPDSAYLFESLSQKAFAGEL